MQQVGWTTPRHGICFSTNSGIVRRFYIVRTSDGYTVSDTVVGDLARVTSLAAARAWAEIRAGGESVRHGRIAGDTEEQ